MTEDDERTAERGLKKLQKRSKKSTEGLEWVRLGGNSKMRKTAAVGDRMILVWGDKPSSKRLEVYSPVTILARERGKKADFFYYDENEYRLPRLNKSGFKALVKQLDSKLNPSQRMVRELSNEILQMLEETWPRQ